MAVQLNAGTGGVPASADLLNASTGLNGGAPDLTSEQVQRVKVGFGSDSFLRDVDAANPLPVLLPDVVAIGTITVTDAVVGAPAGAGAFVSGASTAGSLVAVQCAGGDAAWNAQVTGLTSGTLWFEGSLDSTTGTDGNWTALNGRLSGATNATLAFNATANGLYRGNTAGLAWVRMRSVGALTGTPAIRFRVSDGTGGVYLSANLPAGTNTIGAVNIAAAQTIAVTNTGTFAVQGTLSAETTKVIGTVNLSAAQTLATVTTVGAVTAITNALPTGANTIGAVNVAAAQTLATVTTVGTVSAITAGPAQASGFFSRVTDGANTSAVKAASGIAAAADPALVVAISPNSPAIPASTLVVSTTAAANAALTLTIPTAGAGLFHYITAIEITRTATAALTGTATLVITTTNLPGSLAFSVGNAMVAGGTQKDFDRQFTSPLKSSVANTATTIVMPIPGAAVLWRANVFYYTGP